MEGVLVALLGACARGEGVDSEDRLLLAPTWGWNVRKEPHDAYEVWFCFTL